MGTIDKINLLLAKKGMTGAALSRGAKIIDNTRQIMSITTS